MQSPKPQSIVMSRACCRVSTLAFSLKSSASFKWITINWMLMVCVTASVLPRQYPSCLWAREVASQHIIIVTAQDHHSSRRWSRMSGAWAKARLEIHHCGHFYFVGSADAEPAQMDLLCGGTVTLYTWIEVLLTTLRLALDGRVWNTSVL